MVGTSDASSTSSTSPEGGREDGQANFDGQTNSSEQSNKQAADGSKKPPKRCEFHGGWRDGHELEFHLLSSFPCLGLRLRLKISAPWRALTPTLRVSDTGPLRRRGLCCSSERRTFTPAQRGAFQQKSPEQSSHI